MASNKLRAKIVEVFGTQADFGAAIGERESVISRVVRGRRELSREKKKIWANALQVENLDSLMECSRGVGNA